MYNKFSLETEIGPHETFIVRVCECLPGTYAIQQFIVSHNHISRFVRSYTTAYLTVNEFGQIVHV